VVFEKIVRRDRAAGQPPDLCCHHARWPAAPGDKIADVALAGVQAVRDFDLSQVVLSDPLGELHHRDIRKIIALDDAIGDDDIQPRPSPQGIHPMTAKFAPPPPPGTPGIGGTPEERRALLRRIEQIPPPVVYIGSQWPAPDRREIQPWQVFLYVACLVMGVPTGIGVLLAVLLTL